MKIGFVIADENEYIPFLNFAKENNCKESIRRNRESVEFTYAGKELVAVKAGIGKVNAATTAAFLIADDKVDTIINFGLSGAISGGADTFFGKNKGRTMEAKLAKFTKIAGAIFFVLALVSSLLVLFGA